MAYTHSKPAQDATAGERRAQLLGDRLTLEELGAALGLGTSAVYGLLRGGLPFTRIGRRRYVGLAEAKSWLDAQAQAQRVDRNVRPSPGRPPKRPLPLRRAG